MFSRFLIIFSILILFVVVENKGYGQSENDALWKKHSNNYFNMTLEIPNNWRLTEETSRFDENKQLYIDNQGVNDFRNDVTARIGFFLVNMSEGPKEYIENDKNSTLSLGLDDDTAVRVIEDVTQNKYNISSGDSFSVLYKERTSDFDTATEKIAFTHNGQSYMFLIMVTPPNFYDNPKFTEIRERVINSIVFHPQNSTE